MPPRRMYACQLVPGAWQTHGEGIQQREAVNCCRLLRVLTSNAHLHGQTLNWSPGTQVNTMTGPAFMVLFFFFNYGNQPLVY